MFYVKQVASKFNIRYQNPITRWFSITHRVYQGRCFLILLTVFQIQLATTIQWAWIGTHITHNCMWLVQTLSRLVERIHSSVRSPFQVCCMNSRVEYKCKPLWMLSSYIRKYGTILLNMDVHKCLLEQSCWRVTAPDLHSLSSLLSLFLDSSLSRICNSLTAFSL